jgi:hypothetical protein
MDGWISVDGIMYFISILFQFRRNCIKLVGFLIAKSFACYSDISHYS